MLYLSFPEVTALQRLKYLRQRLFVQRLLELTDNHAHPVWVVPTAESAFPYGGLARDDMGRQAARRVLATAEHLQVSLLAAGGSVEWQKVVFRNFVLDRGNRFAGASFESRLEQITSPPANAPSTEKVRLYWPLLGTLPTRGLIPGGQPRLHPNGALPHGADILRKKAGAPFLGVATLPFDSHGASDRYQAASQLRSEGSVLLDIIRICNPTAVFGGGAALDIASSGPSDGQWLTAPTIPRLYEGRIDGAMSKLLAAYQEDPFNPELRRLVNSARWLAMFITRWWETPVFATPMLYMAIEAIYGKCVWGHHKKCTEDHKSAVEIFADSAKPALTKELIDFVHHRVGGTVERTGAEHKWCRHVSLIPAQRRRETDWLRRVRSQLTAVQSATPDEMDDPLLLWKTDFVLEADVSGQAKQVAENGLRELQLARHAIAHEGQQMAEELRAFQLARLGIEILCITFDRALP